MSLHREGVFISFNPVKRNVFEIRVSALLEISKGLGISFSQLKAIFHEPNNINSDNTVRNILQYTSRTFQRHVCQTSTFKVSCKVFCWNPSFWRLSQSAWLQVTKQSRREQPARRATHRRLKCFENFVGWRRLDALCRFSTSFDVERQLPWLWWD